MLKHKNQAPPSIFVFHEQRYKCAIQKYTRIFLCCFISAIKCCIALCSNTTMPDPMQHTTPHSYPPKTASKFFPGLPCPQTSTQTNTLGTSCTDMFKAEWTPLKMCMGCLRNSSRSGWPSRTGESQPDLVHPKRWWAVIDSRGHTPYWYVCPSVTKKKKKWFNFFLNCDLHHFQNEIWWTWFFCWISQSHQICLFFWTVQKQASVPTNINIMLTFSKFNALCM